MFNPPIRATLDPAVIDAWTVVLADYRRRYGLIYTLFAGAGLVFAGLAIWDHSHPYVLGVAVCVVAASVVDQSARDGIRCPHCHERPFLSARHSSIASIEWCEKCLYWLRKPY